MATRFSAQSDLRKWVSEHSVDNLSATEIDEITNHIAGDANFPTWGEDCMEYLDSLPQLEKLLDELQDEQ
jgi:hypothetical protein